MKGKKLRWSGSNAAMQEHEAALQANPPRYKKPKKRKKHKQRAQPEAPPHPHIPYGEYLVSPWWKTKRGQKLKSVGNRCQRCNNQERLQVHHLHYRSLWREKNSDLEVLCRGCHQKEHECLVQADSHLKAIARKRCQ